MYKTCLIAIAVILFFNFTAKCQEQDTVKLEEITVTAAPALLVPKFSLPGSVDRLNRDLLLASWSRTGAETLENASGVWLQKTNHGGGAPIIRGLTGNQVLLMLDGIRLNNSIYRYGPNQYLSQVNPGWIHHVDIKRGSGSVEYGSDALGGAVNIITGKPVFSDVSQLRIDFGTSLGTHYRFKNFTEISGTGNLAFTGRNIYVRAGYTNSLFGDFVSGSPEKLQVASGYREQAGNFKYAQKINGNNTLTVAWFRDVQKDVGRTDKMESAYDEYYFDPQIMDLAYARWTITTTGRWAEKIEATASYNRLEENRRMTRAGSSLRNNESDIVNTLGASVTVLSSPAKNWTAASGVEFYHDRVNSTAFRINRQEGLRVSYRGLYADNSELYSASVFTNHIVKIENLNLNFGARFNHTLIEGTDNEFGDFRLSPNALVGSAGINYELIDGFAITAVVSNGFRSPNINDISSFGLFDYGFEVPAPDLKPEKSLSSEIGMKLFARKFSGTLAAWQTNLFDLIVRQPGTLYGDTLYLDERVYRKTNTDRALIRGIEGDFTWIPFRKMTVSGNMAYTFGKDLQNGDPLRRIPPLFGQMKGIFNFTGRISAGTIIKAAGRQSRLSSGDIDDDRIPAGGTPGWYCLDAYAAYTARAWVLTAHILNITNYDYRIHGSGLQQPGRGFLIKLQSR